MQISALIQSVWQNNDIYIFQQFNVGHFIILGIKMFAVRSIEPVIITYFFWFRFFHLKYQWSGKAFTDTVGNCCFFEGLSAVDDRLDNYNQCSFCSISLDIYTSTMEYTEA